MSASIYDLSLPLVAKITGYVCSAEEKPHLVSKLFLAARQKAIQQEWREGAYMNNRSPPFAVERIEEERAKIDLLWQKIRNKLNGFYPPARRIAHLWGQLINNHGNSSDLLQSEDLFFCMDSTLYAKAIGRWKEHLNQRINLLEQEPINWQEQIRCIRTFNAREGLAVSERSIQLLEEGDPENPQKITACFKQLYKRQKEIACQTPAGELSFNRISRDCSFLSTLAREYVVQDTMCEMHTNLFYSWAKIRGRLGALPAGIPDANADTTTIRNWMNDPANQPHLDKICYLHFEEAPITAIPQEIVKLRYLQGIQIRGVSKLPAFLAELRYLDHIFDSYQNGVTEIPDALYRHLESSLYFMDSRITYSGKLTRIPFRMWFKERFKLPHYFLLEKGISCMDNFWANSYWRRSIFSFLSYLVMWTVLLPIDLLLINAPIFLINLFLIDVVEPIVTFVRDLSGISRMVRIK